MDELKCPAGPARDRQRHGIFSDLGNSDTNHVHHFDVYTGHRLRLRVIGKVDVATLEIFVRPLPLEAERDLVTFEYHGIYDPAFRLSLHVRNDSLALRVNELLVSIQQFFDFTLRRHRLAIQSIGDGLL